MKFNQLGRTEIKVSEICLGTMTWGSQNSEAQGHEQMDYAVERGVNFFDTAEMYPTTPASAESAGRTEEIIGSWFKASGKRNDIILATKVTGEGLKWIQGGAPISGEKNPKITGRQPATTTDRLHRSLPVALAQSRLLPLSPELGFRSDITES